MKKQNYLARICGTIAILLSITLVTNATAVRPTAISRSYNGQLLGGFVDVTGPGGGGRVYLGSTFADSSADGRIVVFVSTNAASEFVPGVSDLPVPLANNVFVRDTSTNTTTCVSCRMFQGSYGSWGGFTPRITPNGRYVVFAGQPASQLFIDPVQIWRVDLQTGTEQLVSVGAGGAFGNAPSSSPVINDDGRYVAFISQATNLIGASTGNGYQVFVRDIEAGQTFLASHAMGTSVTPGNAQVDITQPLSISSNGRFAVWTSAASNYSPFIADTNGVNDVFYFDVLSAANNIGAASINFIGNSTANGVSNGGIISPATASFPPLIVFASNATDIDAADTSANTDIYRYQGDAKLVSISRNATGSNGVASPRPTISANGRYVSFSSTASNLVTGFDEATNTTPDVFLRDLQTNTTSYVSLSSTNSASTTLTGAFLPGVNAFAGQGANLYLSRNISADARYVAFITAERLSVRDNNGTLDVYVRDRLSGASILASLGRSLNTGQTTSAPNVGDLALAAGGKKVFFTTLATNLSADDGTTSQNPKAYQANISLMSERPPSDLNGDQISDYAVFRPSEGAWYSLFDPAGGAFDTFFFGEAGVRIVPGDYDGDGKTDHAVFTPSTGRWDILNSSNSSPATIFFGSASDILTPADFDGDGRTDLAYFRPSTGNWTILQSNSNSLRTFHFGLSSDVPVVGDFDADNRADAAVFRPSTGEWWILRSTDNSFFGVKWGLSGDKPLVGDFDGDGKTDFTVFRGGTWYILYSRDGNFRIENWGLASDRPVVSDYDGDRKADIAVYRPSDGIWYILQSGTNTFAGVRWGTNSDIPLPSAYVP